MPEPSGRMEGKSIVITGGASGLGEATVRLFHDEGASVVIADVADDLGQGIAEELGERVIFQHCDVALEPDVAGAVAAAEENFGKLDVMFNNAGIGGSPASILKHTVEDWDRSVAVHLRGVFLGIKHGGLAMKKHGKGAIVNTASVSAHISGVSPYPYTAAKAGIFHLTRMAGLELGEYGIRVNSISPGMFFTRIYSGHLAEDQVEASRQMHAEGSEAHNPMHRMGEPIEIAKTVMFLASDEASYINAEDIRVDGGGTVGVRWSNSSFGRWEREHEQQQGGS